MGKKLTISIAASIATSLLSLSPAKATPPNTATLDGVPVEYDDTDRVGTFTDAPGWGSANVISNLFVTWDDDYLYVALQGFSDNNKIAVLLDVDPGNGTGASTTTNWPGNPSGAIAFNGPGWIEAPGFADFGLDYVIASEGFFNTILRIGYDGVQPPVAGGNVEVIFDHGNAASPQLTPIDMVVLEDSTSCPLKGFEARIPWTELYSTNRFGRVGPTGVVPTGATLRVFAHLHNNNPDAFSSPDTIPVRVSPNSSYNNGVLVTDDYLDVVVDANNDGLPDVAPGDVNAPYIQSASGAESSTSVILQYNEPVVGPAVTNHTNYTINGVAAIQATRALPNAVRLTTASPLPAGGSIVRLASQGIEDAAGNSKLANACFTVGSGGTTNDVTVRFILETASGFGPSATAFHLNADVFPLEEGLPPSMATPLTNVAGSVFAVDVTFPVGTPQQVAYRFSGLRSDTGTNTYEAIRLDNYENVARRLELNQTGAAMVVTSWLGAAAAPYRTGGEGYDALYVDSTRGDAGVRERTTVLFQLDLSSRNIGDIEHVLIQGSDPLRGFNASGVPGSGFDNNIGDWAGNVGWNIGGLKMADDGTQGDKVAFDGIYSLEWAFTPDGRDSVLVQNSPNSLVGGQEPIGPNPGTPPYDGGWQDRRSPRIAVYKFYVVDSNLDWLESPAANLEILVSESDAPHRELAPFIWENGALPLASALNPAEITSVTSGTTVHELVYENIRQAADNAVEVASAPGETWRAYDLEGVGDSSGVFTALVEAVTNHLEVFRVVTPGYPYDMVDWTPHPIPTNGGVLQVRFTQNNRNLQGKREISWQGQIPRNGATQTLPMTFLSNGVWTVDVTIPAGTSGDLVDFEFVSGDGSVTNQAGIGKKFAAYIGGRATWTPERPVSGGTITIVYDASGGPLAGDPNVNLWSGFDGWDGITPNWDGAPGVAMINRGPDLWEYTLDVPTSATYSVNWVFNAGPIPPGGTTDWDSSEDWHAFIEE